MIPGPLAVLGAVVAGIAVGDRLPPAPAGEWLGAAALVTSAAVLTRPRARGLLIVAAAGLLAVGVTLRARHGLEDSPLVGAARVGTGLTAPGTLVGDPVPQRFSTRAVVRIAGRHVLVTATRPAASRLAVLEAGDRVVLSGRLESLTTPERRWARRHVVAALRLTDVLDVRPPGHPLLHLANPLRRAVLRGNEGLPPGDRGLLAGFLLGDTRGLPGPLADAFRASGLAHLLAVSGANVAFVLALVSPLVRRCSLTGRWAVGLAVVLVFAAMTRWEPSVLRAGAMAGLAMTGSWLGRPTAGLRTLLVAAAGLLLLDPFLLWSPGFRLSCGASAGILLLTPRIHRHVRGPAWVRDAVATTAGAQVGVAPALIPLFGSMPLVAIPANLLAAPVTGPLTVWGFASGLAAGLTGSVLPELGSLLQVPTAVLVRYVAAVATLAARVPLAVDARTAWLLGGVVSLGLALARLRASRVGRSASPPGAGDREERGGVAVEGGDERGAPVASR